MDADTRTHAPLRFYVWSHIFLAYAPGLTRERAAEFQRRILALADELGIYLGGGLVETDEDGAPMEYANDPAE